MKYHVGAQNDALFIIMGAPPAQGNDYPNHGADRLVIAKVLDSSLAQQLVIDANAQPILGTLESSAPFSIGADRIATERRRQIEVERWTPEHDDEHDDASLALAAICYAAPEPVYVRRGHAAQIIFTDPWPASWARRWDKRPMRSTAAYTDEQSIDLLVKAGALLAAEIDRRLRAQARQAGDSHGL
jgi:hypothetical protein